jgi:hypothetical protein
MGYYFMDQFSLLHFAVGVIMYFWNFSLLSAFIIHFIFEILENSSTGVFYIQKYIIKPGYFDWPGGKSDPDSITNIIGDNVFFIIGWIVAYYCDYYGRKYEYYTEEGLKKFWE